MQKRIYYFGTLLTLAAFIGIIFMPRNTHAKSLFQNNGAPTEQLKRVFTHMGVPVATLSEANEFAQKHFIRKGERWDKQEETEINQKVRLQEKLLRDDLKGLGMIDDIVPTQKAYSYALLMGGLKERFMQRLDLITELQKQGYTFNTIVLLGGERQLRDEEKEGLPENVNTEAQMMLYLYEHHYEKPIGQQLLVVNAPMIQKEDGTFTRPTTDSTLVHFSEIAPHTGSCLMISNNPYVVRQTKVTQRILDQSRFPTQGAGKAVQQDSDDIVMLMDEFARTLYEEYRSQK
jgi:hypothetical protein